MSTTDSSILLFETFDLKYETDTECGSEYQHCTDIELMKTRKISWLRNIGVISGLTLNEISEELKPLRLEYTRLYETYHNMSIPVSSSDAEKSPSNEDKTLQRADLYLMREIWSDVVRTQQARELFTRDETRRMLQRILFTWSKDNPDVLYKQGMNEIVGMLTIAFYRCALHKPSPSCSHNSIFLIGVGNIEADVYLCLRKLLEKGTGLRKMFSNPRVPRPDAVHPNLNKNDSSLEQSRNGLFQDEHQEIISNDTTKTGHHNFKKGSNSNVLPRESAASNLIDVLGVSDYSSTNANLHLNRGNYDSSFVSMSRQQSSSHRHHLRCSGRRDLLSSSSARKDSSSSSINTNALLLSAHPSKNLLSSSAYSSIPPSSHQRSQLSSAYGGELSVMHPNLVICMRTLNGLEKINRRLMLHLTKLEIEPQLFLQKWICLLFTREFPLETSLHLWDYLFEDSHTQRLISKQRHHHSSKPHNNNNNNNLISTPPSDIFPGLTLVPYVAHALIISIAHILLAAKDEMDALGPLIHYEAPYPLDTLLAVALAARGGMSVSFDANGAVIGKSVSMLQQQNSDSDFNVHNNNNNNILGAKHNPVAGSSLPTQLHNANLDTNCMNETKHPQLQQPPPLNNKFINIPYFHHQIENPPQPHKFPPPPSLLPPPLSPLSTISTPPSVPPPTTNNANVVLNTAAAALPNKSSAQQQLNNKLIAHGCIRHHRISPIATPQPTVDVQASTLSPPPPILTNQINSMATTTTNLPLINYYENKNVYLHHVDNVNGGGSSNELPIVTQLASSSYSASSDRNQTTSVSAALGMGRAQPQLPLQPLKLSPSKHVSEMYSTPIRADDLIVSNSNNIQSTTPLTAEGAGASQIPSITYLESTQNFQQLNQSHHIIGNVEHRFGCGRVFITPPSSQPPSASRSPITDHHHQLFSFSNDSNINNDYFLKTGIQEEKNNTSAVEKSDSESKLKAATSTATSVSTSTGSKTSQSTRLLSWLWGE